MALRPRSSVGHDEIRVLKLLALEEGVTGEITITGSSLADRLGVSSQTALRRLRRLENAHLLERERGAGGQLLTITDDGRRALRAEYDDYRRIFE